MTISNTARTAGPYTGTGANTAFPFSFKVFGRTDLLVARTVTATGVETVLVLDVDYAVLLNPNQNTSPGGTITLAAPLAVGLSLAATSNLPIQQSLDLTNQGGFYPTVINDALDRIVITIQQLAARVGVGALNVGAAATIAAVLATLTNLAGAAGSSLVGFMQAGIGAVLRTMQDKGRDFVSVKDFGAKCDGVTDDWAAIQKAQEHLKLRGGGTIYFPGWCAISQPFSFYGSVVGATPIAYPNPTQPKITWASNGAGGIRSSISSGNILQFAKAANPLFYHVGFKDFVIDAQANNVIAVNGAGPDGIYGPNHYIDIDGLTIHGLEGPNAIGVDFGSITDSTCRQLIVQGWNSAGYAGWRLNKTDVQLVECHSYYMKHGLVVGVLAEACIQMFGGSLQSCKEDCIYWEAPVADSKASASVLVGVFLGETNIGSKILGALTPASLDIGAITFQGCTFDNYRVGQNLMDITWGGLFTFIGNYYYNSGVGALNTVDFGQYCKVVWLNNGFDIKPGCAALAQNQVNNLIGNASPQTSPFTPSLAATGSTFAYATDGQKGFYTKIGNLVTVVIRMQLAAAGNTFSGSAVTITGLPFTSSNGTFQTAEGSAVWANIATPLVAMPAQISQNTNYISLAKLAAASTSAFNPLLGTDLANNSVVEITMQYQA